MGLTLVALFSAAMSSLDSVLNSLSAVTMEDFVKRNKILNYFSKKNNLFFSRLITFFAIVINLLLFISETRYPL